MFENEPNSWSADALIKLDSFLNAYTESLEGKAWCRRYHYIDAFSGSGTSVELDGKIRLNESDCLIAIAEYGQNQAEHVEFTCGSPNTAVEISNRFSSYAFIEQSLKRNDLLEALSKEYQSLKIRVVHESCSSYLRRFSQRTDWKSQRALVFLDPFRMQINWETLVLLAKTKAIEILLNFPVGVALQRILPLDSANMTSARRACLDRFFGSMEWFDILYSKRTASEQYRGNERVNTGTNLAQTTSSIRTTDPGRRLVTWYRKRLTTIFAVVSKPYLVRNMNVGQVYYLIFAAHKTSSVDLAQNFLDLGVLEG